MKKLFGEHWIKDTLIEIVGSFLAGIAVYNFAASAEFPMTGFAGLALIFYRLFGLPIGLVTVVLNIPVALICYRVIGRHFFFRSVRCILISSFFTDYVAPLFPMYVGSRMISAICCGLIGGVGYAMIYFRNSSTGGTDFIVMAIKAVRPHIGLGTLIFAVDCGVILLGGLLFRDFEGIVYALIINYLFAIVSDKLLYGMNAGKLALIVTDYGKEVSQQIDALCGRGSTLIDARGAWKEDRRDVVMCACSKKDMLLVEQGVR